MRIIDVLVNAFRVDGIPHMAFVTETAEVKTALIGQVPKNILVSEIEALIKVSNIKLYIITCHLKL